MSLLAEIIIFLIAAVVMVPLARFAGLGAVLGFLVAGVIIGPWGLALIDDVDTILHFSEFGIILFAVAVDEGVMAPELVAQLIVVASISMALTPLLYMANERFLQPRLARIERRSREQLEELFSEDRRLLQEGRDTD